MVLCRQKRNERGKARGFSLNSCHIGLRLHLHARLSCVRLAGGPVRKNCADVRKERVSGWKWRGRPHLSAGAAWLKLISRLFLSQGHSLWKNLKSCECFSRLFLCWLCHRTGGKSVSSIGGLHTVSYDVYLALLCVSLLSFVHVPTQAQRTSSHRWGV